MEEFRKSFQRIDSLFKKASDAEMDDFVRAQLAQLICVLTSGAIETACQSVLGGHCENTASARAARYARKQLSGFMNPKPQKIKDLLAAFDEDWVQELDKFWQGEIKDSIGSLVRHRNLISHGKQTTVSLAQVRPWVNCSEKFCNKLLDIVSGK